MNKQLCPKRAAAQIPIIVGLASVAAAALLLSRVLVQNTETAPENLTPPTDQQQVINNQPPTNIEPVPLPGTQQPGPTPPESQTPQPSSGQFFCYSLQRQATAEECDAADKARKNQPDPNTGSAQPINQTGPQPFVEPSASTNNQINSQETQKQNMMPENVVEQQEFIDPKEIRQVIQEMSQLKKEATKIAKKLTKAKNMNDELTKINEISSQLDKFIAEMKTATEVEDIREIMEEFRDAAYWDTVQEIRARLEIPTNIIRIEKELTKLERTIKLKSMTKLGLDMEIVKEHIAEMKNNLNELRTKFNEGDIEEAMSLMQAFGEEMHPGDISCTLYSLKDATLNLPRIKDPEIKQTIQDVLDPIIEAAQDGDYRNACQSLNEVRPEIMKVVQTVMKSSKNINPQMLERIEKLQQVIDQKFGGQNESTEID